MHKLILWITLLLLLAGPVGARPQLTTPDCHETTVRYTVNTDYTTNVGAGGFDFQALEGVEAKWTKVIKGSNSIGDCFEWISTNSNFQIKHVCPNRYFVVVFHLVMSLPTSAASLMQNYTAGHSSDVNFNIFNVWPRATGDPAGPQQVLLFDHHPNAGAFAMWNHTIRFELTQDWHYGYMFWYGSGGSPLMTVKKGTYYEFTSDSCSRGRTS